MAAAARAMCSTAKVSVPTGRWGPCCSVAPVGRTRRVSGATARASARVISLRRRRVGMGDLRVLNEELRIENGEGLWGGGGDGPVGEGEVGELREVAMVAGDESCADGTGNRGDAEVLRA